MDEFANRGASIPDALIHWSTAGALIAFGVMFFNDTVIMGRTILTLGLLSASNEALKLRGKRTGSTSGYREVRMVVACAYVALMVIGFLFPPTP